MVYEAKVVVNLLCPDFVFSTLRIILKEQLRRERRVVFRQEVSLLSWDRDTWDKYRTT